MTNTIRRLRRYIILIVGLPIIIFFTIFIYQKFNVKKIIIISDDTSLRGLTILNNNNLLFIDEKKISEYFLKHNPTLKSINIVKSLPQTLILRIGKRMPVAQIETISGKMYLDQDGIILSGDDNYSELPKIITPDISVDVNQKADWRVVKAASFVQEVRKQGIIIEQISVNDASGTFSAKTANGVEIILGYNADIPAKASSLQVIILRFRIEGKNINKIDLQFDKPLVTLSNGEKISSNLPAQAGF